MAVVPELAFGAEELLTSNHVRLGNKNKKIAYGELVAVLDDWGVVTLAEGLWPVGVAPLAAVAPKEKEVTVVVPPRQLDEAVKIRQCYKMTRTNRNCTRCLRPTTTVTKPEISVLPVLSRTENCS